MSGYAVREDALGWRAVGGAAEVGPDECYSEDHPALTAPVLTRDEVERLRLRAYAEPVTGSDRYFAEAQRESLLGNAEAAEAAKARGLARFAEIQAANPWPAE